MGDAVRVSTVAIAQGNLTISVQESPVASQPTPFSRGGETVVLPQTDVAVEEELGRQMRIVGGGASSPPSSTASTPSASARAT